MTVFDTTLRDGEQTPGISFTLSQKIDIARQLSDIGVYTIEAGFPASSESERETVKTIAALDLESNICGLARMLKADIDTCLDCDVDMVHVFIPTSRVQREHTIKKSAEEVLEITRSTVAYARDHFGMVMFSAMDATRTEWDYLIRVLKAAVESGATIVNVPDTVGVITPGAMRELITRIAGEVDAPIDVHCHNDFGLAVANTLAAVEGGASQVQVTVNGLGERAGNADLAETVMALESIYGISTGIRTRKIVETSRLVSRYSGISLVPTQPIVGDNAFSHESGIHSHGVIACSETFEPGILTPEMVGHRRRLKLGKHVGRHAVRQMLEDAHISPSEAELDEIVLRIKAIAGKGKRVTDADLYEIADSVMGTTNGRKILELEGIAVMTGNHVIPTATIKAKVNGSDHVFSSVGNGPVDAAMKAVLGILPTHVQLKEFNIEAISGGTDAIGHVTIAVEDEGGRIISASASSDDIILASVEAMVNAINLLHRT
ncbi:MAG: 2-isopropylmalate synthase [Methanomicrobiales archaeon]|nr:2-isopropylmalate synthase [Methanomicrobiales archaeon]MDI6877066.1 2-isopropylmalate synthase [Methanomicrobiales archaeon]